MTERVSYAEAKIPNGTALSNQVDLRNHNLVGLEMPAAYTAAKVSFKSCVRNDGAGPTTALTETFLPVVDNAGIEVSITCAQGQYVTFPASLIEALRGLARVIVVSGTNAAPVNQGQDSVLRLILDQRR